MPCHKRFAWLLIALPTILCACAFKPASASQYDQICRYPPPRRFFRSDCDPAKNLHCDPHRRTCLCANPSAPLNNTHVHRWDKQADSCVLIHKDDLDKYVECARLHFQLNGTRANAHGELRPVCKLDAECQATGLGRHARCNLDRCTCECLNVTVTASPTTDGGSGEGNERTVGQINGVCYVERRLGDPCGAPQECLSIEGGAACLLAQQESSAICACVNEGFMRVGEACVRITRNTTQAPTPPSGGDVSSSVVNSTTSTTVETETTDPSPSQPLPAFVSSPTPDSPDLRTDATPKPEPLPLPILPTMPVYSANASTPAKATTLAPDSTSTVDWAKPTIIICTAFIVTILVTGLLVAYSNWNRIRLMRDMHLQRQAQGGCASSKEPMLLRGLGPGLDLLEEDFDVDRDEVLGSGRNGIVYRGYFRPHALQVAVKTNRDLTSSEVYLRAILEEAKVLSYLGQHPSVVQFYGICQATIRTGHVYLLCELCPLGSLEAFLRGKREMFEFSCARNCQATPSPRDVHSHSQGQVFTHSSTATPPPGSEDRSDYRASMLIAESRASSASASSDGFSSSKLGPAHLFCWAHQIASAMEFVSARKVIHSDLATRNVLLASLDCVKLTDFGLSRRLYDNYTYIKTGTDPLPWKWLDHDALRFHMFTTWTDVWSFGICLWEMWTLGEVPYPGILTPGCQDFLPRLLEGLHPNRPEGVSDELYAVMLMCWSPSKMERPTFSWLKETLAGLMRKEGYGYPGGKGKEELDGFGYLLPREYSK